jgi:hypothetical protein
MRRQDFITLPAVRQRRDCSSHPHSGATGRAPRRRSSSARRVALFCGGLLGSSKARAGEGQSAQLTSSPAAQAGTRYNRMLHQTITCAHVSCCRVCAQERLKLFLVELPPANRTAVNWLSDLRDACCEHWPVRFVE